MFNHQTVNPGFAGSGDAINASLLNRLQWSGFPGAPVTTVFNVDATVNMVGREDGIGLTIINDEIGYEKNVSVGIVYSWRFRAGGGDLGIGFSGGLLSKTLNPGWTQDDGYGMVDDTDPLIPDGEVSGFTGDLGVGLFYEHNKYYIGFSVKHLNKSSFFYEEYGKYSLVRHYYFTGGYNIKLDNPLFEMKPSVFFKTDFSGYQVDMNMNIHYDNRLWGGISYRMNDAVVVLLGTEMRNGLKIGYAYDIATSAVSSYSSGSHEFYLAYSFSIGKRRVQKYKSVRYL